MIRKFLCFVVLVAMTLHCSSRLGILSYVFQKRHVIAYSVGLVAELPIALCSAEYDFGHGLVILDHNDENSTLPVQWTQANEIHLFFHVTEIEVNHHFVALDEHHFTQVLHQKYAAPGLSVFHPPA